MTSKQFYVTLTTDLKEGLDKVAALASDLKKVDADISSGTFSEDHVRAVLRPKSAEIKKEIERAQEDARKAAQATINKFAKELRDADALNPAELTDDVRLLELGTLRKQDILAIIERNADNRTMVQLALRAAEDRGIDLDGLRYTTNESRARHAEALRYVVDVALRWSTQPEKQMFGKLFGEGTEVHRVYCDETAL
ncbi:MAG: hypothetical protein IJO37_02380 [Ruminiclostridium sp.]|nr:hypothetical protein [Ruminiclostridium sp.]